MPSLSPEKIVEDLSSTYKFFHPENNKIVNVWARLITDALDEEESQIENHRIIVFELLTEKQVGTRIEYFSFPQVPFAYASYYFIASIPTELYSSEIFQRFATQCKERQYLNVTLRSTPQNISSKLCIDGTAILSYSVPYEYRNDSKLPPATPAYLCWEPNSECISAVYEKILAELQNSYHTETVTNNFSETPYEHSADTEFISGSMPGTCSAPNNVSTNINIKIFKVGPANTVYIEYPNGKSLLFDCGLLSHNTNYYAEARTYIRKYVKPTAILISHWHVDHYLLLDDIDDSRLEHIFINGKDAPPYGAETSIKNKELSRKITRISLLPSMGKNVLQQYGYPDTCLFFGNGQRPPANTRLALGKLTYNGSDVNDNGIILVIGNTQNRMILPSDVSYYCWPADPLLSLTDLKYLLLPHHGCGVYTRQYGHPNMIQDKKIYASRYGSSIFDIKPKPENGNSYSYHCRFIQHEMLISNVKKDIAYTDLISDPSKPYYEVRL